MYKLVNIIKSKPSIKFKIAVGFSIVFLVMVSVQYQLNRSIANVIASQEELLVSTQLLTNIEAIKSSVCFFESKVKTYVLTGNDSLLESNEVYLTTITQKFNALKKLSPNAAQVVAINKLVKLLNAQIQFIDEVLFQYQVAPPKSIALIKTGNGKILMIGIIKQLDGIHDIEQHKYTHIINKNKVYSTTVKTMAASAYLLAFILVLLLIIILFRDINRREKLEYELHSTQQKAEAATIIKEQFMANMSHEIRTPLNAIIGFNERLIKTDLNAQQLEYAAAVHTSGENLLAIVNDILDLSKIEAGMVRIEQIKFLLPPLLHSVVTMFLVQAKEKQVQLQLSIAHDMPPCVLGDPNRLTQILINLIGNALKFTTEGSVTITVSFSVIDVQNISVQFHVKDTGIGISKEKIAEIFDRFTQAKSDTSRIYGGTGLGLSIAKKLVELQQGTITVESQKNKGSLFSFTIPYLISNTISHNVFMPLHNALPAIEASLIKILIVEDNILNQKLAGFMLADWGYTYDICSNGKLAIDQLQTNTYQLILMDIQMPEMNGYETTHYIRTVLKLTVPIIAMTAHALPGEKEKCVSLGMTDYISKPIKEELLHQLIIQYTNVKNYSL